MLKNTQHDITIRGLHLNPQAIVAVWIGKYRVSYQQVSQTEIRVASPIVSTIEDIAVDVKLETLMPDHYSNVQQVIYTKSLNISSVDRMLLVSGTGIQDIVLIGSDYK